MDERPEPVYRHTRLREIPGLGELPTVVSREAELAELDRHLAQGTTSATIAVVDEERRLVGVIPLGRLIEHMFLRLMPGEFLSELLDADRMAELSHLLLARRAREVMRRPICVTWDSTLGEAFALMHLNALLGLPIVDEERRVVGNADLVQLLHLWRERHTSSQPS